MTVVSAIFLGFIQGLCEFLPISSSGHLALVRHWGTLSLPIENALAFDVLLHLGTLIAVLIVCRKEVGLCIGGSAMLLSRLWSGERRRTPIAPAERLSLLLLLASLPMAFALLLDGAVEGMADSVRWIGVALMLNAVLLFFCDKVRTGGVGLYEMKARNALWVGCGQLFAVIPGLSRSGTTTVFGVFSGMEHASAVRFSFLLSLPTVFCANLVHLPSLVRTPLTAEQGAACLLGALTAMAVGMAAMHWIERMSLKKRFSDFALYCLLLGGVAVIIG